MNRRLHESLAGDMKLASDEFDDFCRQQKYEYSIGTDEYNEQAYKVEDEYNPSDLIKHMETFIDGKSVTMDFDKDKYGTTFIFRIKSLAENEISEDQYKFASRHSIKGQSAFPSSIAPSRTVSGRGEDGVSANYEFDEDELDEEPIDDARDPTADITEGFMNHLSACMTTFVEPEILFVIGAEPEETGPNTEQVKAEVLHGIQIMQSAISQLDDIYPAWNDVKRAINDLSRKIENISSTETHTSLEQHIDIAIDSELL